MRKPVLFVNLHPDSNPHLRMAELAFGNTADEVYKNPRFKEISVKTPSKTQFKKIAMRESRTTLSGFGIKDELSEISLDEVSALILTGSSFASYPRFIEDTGDYFIAKWKKQLMEYLNFARAKNIPILAVCFGAQMLAQALGGTVELMKNKTEELVEVGFSKVWMAPDAVFNPLFSYLPHELVVAQNHTDIVTRLPEGATLAFENQFGIQGFTLGDRIFAIEFHPERPRSEVTEYLTSGDNTQRLSRGRVVVKDNLALGAHYDVLLFQIFSRFLQLADNLSA